MDLIPKNYQEMISIPGNQDNELNKFFETIDNLNKPFKLNESKFGLNIRDENGNSILHRIIINSLNEQELLNKIQFIPNIETLINTVNFKHQSPLHLLCKYQYYQVYLLLKNTLEGNEINYLKEEYNIETLIKGDSSIIIKKAKGTDIRYDILDSKNRLPLSYLVVGVDIDKIKCKCSDDAMKAINDFKTFDKNKLNGNKMKQYFYECNFAVETLNHTNNEIEKQEIRGDILPAPNDLITNIKDKDDNNVETNEFIHNLILNNKFVHRYINKDFFDDVVAKTIEKVNVLTRDINVDGIYDLRYFINKTVVAGRAPQYNISEIKSSDYYVAFSVYMFNKIIAKLKYDGTYKINGPDGYSDITKKFICDKTADADSCKNAISKETYKQKVIKQYEEIIETKTSLINKVFMDNQYST